jgi:hypothetical protein
VYHALVLDGTLQGTYDVVLTTKFTEPTGSKTTVKSGNSIE